LLTNPESHFLQSCSQSPEKSSISTREKSANAPLLEETHENSGGQSILARKKMEELRLLEKGSSL
jgi:hypothetical protein